MTLPISFPAVAFMPHTFEGAEPGGESVEVYFSEEGLKWLWGPLLRRGEGRGAIFVDRKRKVWRVLDVVDLGIRNPLRRFIPFLRPYAQHRVRYEVTEEPVMSMEALIERTCAAMLSNPDDWRDDEAVAGEDGEPQDENKMMEKRIAKVRKAKSVSKLVDILDEG